MLRFTNTLIIIIIITFQHAFIVNVTDSDLVLITLKIVFSWTPIAVVCKLLCVCCARRMLESVESCTRQFRCSHDASRRRLQAFLWFYDWLCHSTHGEFIYNTLDESVHNTLCESIHNSLSESVHNTLGESVHNTLGESICNTLGESIRNTHGESIHNTTLIYSQHPC